jgi:ankyrin repeat protein/tRNA A-37 threonylcarbamoyl transferase component Bud32
MKDEFPVHHAIENYSSKDILERLLLKFPDAASVQNNDGDLPVHSAMKKSSAVETVLTLVSAYPEGLSIRNKSGYLPIHLALRNEASADLANLLVSAYPEGVTIGDKFGDLPINLAVANSADAEVVSILLSAYPTGVATKNKDGNLPIHVAVKNKARVEVVSILASAYPEGISMTNKRGDCPIHLALKSNTSVEVVCILVSAYPEGAAVKNNIGDLPLHIALSSYAGAELINVLLLVYPEAASIRNAHDDLPAHVAVGNNAGIEVVTMLLLAYPESSRIRCNDLTLFDVALTRKCEFEILRVIAMNDLPLDNGGAPTLHGFSWTSMLDPSKVDMNDAVLEFVQEIFDRFVRIPGANAQLAYFKDLYGREAIEIAHEKVKALMYKYVFFCERYKIQEGSPKHCSPTSVVVLADDYGVTDMYRHVYTDMIVDPSLDGLSSEKLAQAFEQIRLILNSTMVVDIDDELHDFQQQNRISLPSFMGFCKSKFGESRRVALKLMTDEAQYLQEVNIREGKDLDRSKVIPLLGTYDSQSLILVDSIVKLSVPGVMSMADYRYCLVMPAGERSLDEINRHENLVDIEEIERLALKVAENAVHLHDHLIVHGDMNMKNILKVDGKILIADLDASCEIRSEYAYLGFKFSSGILPPEMFYELKSQDEYNSYVQYWRIEKEGSSQEEWDLFWSKYKPYSMTKRKGKVQQYVVKTYNRKHDGSPSNIESLPYRLLNCDEASVMVDSWGFGLILFEMLAKEPLFAVDINYNLGRGDSLKTFEALTNPKIVRGRIMSIIDSKYSAKGYYADLLLELLDANPRTRISVSDAMRKILRIAAERTPDKVRVETILLQSALATSGNMADVKGNLPIHIEVAKPDANVKTVQTLLLDYPSEVFTKNLDGNLPIHIAVERNASIEVIQLLISAHRRGFYEQNNYGNLPLHLAAQNNASVELVQLILSVYEEGITMKNLDDDIPLHLAAENNTSIELVRLLLERYSEGRKSKNVDGNLPLHLAVEKSASVELVQFLLEAYREALSTKNEDGNLPLHIAIENNTRVELVRLLLKEYPDGMSITNNHGNLIHMAALKSVSFELMELLVSKYPDGIKIKNSDGNLPLHILVENNGDIKQIELLLKANRDGISKRNKFGSIPLHLALEKNASLQVVQLLLSEHRDGISVKNNADNLPLHIAIDYRSSLDVVQALLDAYPNGIRVQNKDGNLPLHVAVENNASTDIIQMLLRAYPGGISTKNKADNLPIHIAVGKNTSVELVQKLLSEYPDSTNVLCSNRSLCDVALLQKNGHEVLKVIVLNDLPLDISGVPKFHGFSWTSLLDPSKTVMHVDVIITIVEEILKSFVHINRANVHLAYCKDSLGRESISIAHEQVKTVLYKYIFFYGRYKIYEGHPKHVSATSVVVLADDYGIMNSYRSVFREVAGKISTVDQSSNDYMSLGEFEAAISRINLTWNRKHIVKDIEDEFKRCDINRDGRISLEEFMVFCKSIFGDSRPVALKFMSEGSQYQQEVNLRKNKELDSSKVMQLLKSYDNEDKLLEKSLETLSIPGVKSMTVYKYCLVMPAASRSLDEIYRYENLRENKEIERLASKVASGLINLHSKGIVHGDVKLMNTVRVDDSVLIIDLDASSEMQENSYLGSKFSSGVLPPEMFYELKGKDEFDKYEQYWQKEKETDIEKAKAGSPDDWNTFWSKYQPFSVSIRSKRKDFVVKTYNRKADGSVSNIEGLPYKLVPSDESRDKIDSWGFGLMLFEMLTKEPLFPIDIKNDFSRSDSYMLSKTFEALTNASVLEQRIRAVVEERSLEGYHLDLLLKLLNKDPDNRLSMQQFYSKLNLSSNQIKLYDGALAIIQSQIIDIAQAQEKHMAISKATYDVAKETLSSVNAIVQQVKHVTELVEESIGLIERTQEVLLRGLFEVQENTVPTVFIILNEKLLPESKSSSSDQSPEVMPPFDKVSAWITKLGRVKDKIAEVVDSVSSAVADPYAAMKDHVASFFEGKPVYLYLVDEFTMQPVIPEEKDPKYPIEITSPAEFVPRLLPLMKIGLKAVSVANGIAGLGRLFGYPVPTIPDEYLKKVRNFVGDLGMESSIAEFPTLKKIVDSRILDEKSNIEVKRVYGATLQDFKSMLKGCDADGKFCGLFRVMTPQGNCIWVTEESYAYIKVSGSIEFRKHRIEDLKDVPIVSETKSILEFGLKYPDGTLVHVA